MATAELAVGIALGIFASIFGYLLLLMGRWLRHRNHVWFELDLRRGKTILKQLATEKDGSLSTEWGRYIGRSDAFTLYKGQPLFRFRQGDMRPIRFTPAKAPTPAALANGGSADLRAWFKAPIELAGAEHVQVPSESVEVFLKQHLFADAYSSRLGLLLLLGIGIIVIFFAVIGLYAR